MDLPVKKIKVGLQFEPNSTIKLGELVWQKNRTYLKMEEEFLKLNLPISPFKLKQIPEIIEAPLLPFEGLFGVFADSLPDGWGRLLLDKKLASLGINFRALTILDRLAFVGNQGFGALVYEPEFKNPDVLTTSIKLDELANNSSQILKEEGINGLDDLYTLGGSTGGARPKVFLWFSPKMDTLYGPAETNLEKLDQWIIKFPNSSDGKDSGRIEFAYYKMALAAGIEMAESRLFTTKKGNAYFGTKRFDRIGEKKIHMHSAAGLMHDDFRHSTIDYGHIMDAAFRLEKDVKAYEKVFRLAAFNVMAHNRDDHSKNFAFLMSANGNWKFAPAYDLTFSNSSYGMHSTTIAGESKNPGEDNLLQLAKHFKLKNAPRIIEQVNSAVSNFNTFAKEAEVKKLTRKHIASQLIF